MALWLGEGMKREDFTTWTEWDPAGAVTPGPESVTVAIGPTSPGEDLWLYKDAESGANFTYLLRLMAGFDPLSFNFGLGLWGFDGALPTHSDTEPEVAVVLVRSLDVPPGWIIAISCASTSQYLEVQAPWSQPVELTIARKGSIFSIDWPEEGVAHPQGEIACSTGSLQYRWAAYAANDIDMEYWRVTWSVDKRRSRRALLTGGGMSSRGLRTGGPIR